MATTPSIIAVDRRRHKRFRVDRPGKVYRRATQGYAAARTRDLSFGGALLEVESPRAFQPGEVVDLGLAVNREAVMSSTSLVRGVVVRAQEIDPQNASRQVIAVRYINAGALNRAA